MTFQVTILFRLDFMSFVVAILNFVGVIFIIAD